MQQQLASRTQVTRSHMFNRHQDTQATPQPLVLAAGNRGESRNAAMQLQGPSCLWTMGGIHKVQ
jgi:hypothetical protein